MDLYTPPSLPASGRLPAVLFIHGGPNGDETALKDLGIFRSYGELSTAFGFIGITFDHRYATPGQLMLAESDVSAAIAFVQKHAEERQIDPERLGLWAFSGGGPLLSGFFRERRSYIRCIAANYAVLDLRGYAPADAPPAITAWVEKYSAASHLKGHTAGLPIFIARAGLDQPIINQAIDRFIQEALVENADIEILNHSQGRHSFDILDNNARSREIIARGLEFMRRHLLELDP